jgi:hypothetical protein
MGDQGEDTRFYRVLVAIETDATRYYGAHASRPRTLDRSDAEQMLSHIAADLKALLPDISNCSLISAGAIFDQTQILRPGYPVFEALEAVPTKRSAEGFRPGLVSIGAEQGNMPVADLQPLEDIPLGLLQLLPLAIQGPPGLVDSLGESMEYRFLEEGQLSAHSAAWLETAFGISINHARFMTLTDLSAMLRLQLEHFGFLPMWELLDAALNGQPNALRVESNGGKTFEWRDGAVFTGFETFDHWATQGAGAGVLAARQMLAGGYGDWTRETRQFLTTLRAHGLEVHFQDPASEEVLQGTFYTEDTGAQAGGSNSSLTEHSFEELGTVAITFVEDDRIFNYYPLLPQGLNDIHAHLRDRVSGGHTVAFPGTILYDENTRRLIPDGSEKPGQRRAG